MIDRAVNTGAIVEQISFSFFRHGRNVIQVVYEIVIPKQALLKGPISGLGKIDSHAKIRLDIERILHEAFGASTTESLIQALSVKLRMKSLPGGQEWGVS